MSFNDVLVQQLLNHEGEKLKAYKCSAGFTTIGVGRNLDSKGITVEESRFMLAHDIEDATRDARIFYADFGYLVPARQAVLIDMAFNLGLGGLLKFRKFQQALEKKDFVEARRQMLASEWAHQVGARADRLAKMMETGLWPQ